MYYLCSENKGADQLRGYREADLRLCFRICKMLVFSRRGSIAFLLVIHYDIRNLMTKRDFDCADPLLSHPEDELIADIMAFHEVISFQTVFSLAEFINL